MSAQNQFAKYERDGYVLFPGLFGDSELGAIEDVLERFHVAWLDDNADLYENGVLNSAYLTGTKYLGEEDRLSLFKFIGSRKVARVLGAVLESEVMFVNSQLFFDPADVHQQNYWHRDIQYGEMTVDQQRALLLNANPLHVRVAMKPERGVGLVPGTHRRWDDEHEYDVRMQRNDQHPHFDLPNGVEVEMQRGDVLVFSAAMIHRGLYGHDRRSFDLLFGDAISDVARFVRTDCLPDAEQLSQLERPSPFKIARELTSAILPA